MSKPHRFRAARWIGCVLLLLLLVVHTAPAQPWEQADTHLSMQAPESWQPFDTELLTTANQQVRHVTGHQFIAGYALSNNTGTRLVFPYLLIQFKPYTDLPEDQRPDAKLDTAGKLTLISHVVDALRLKQPLPPTIDLQTFASQHNSELIQITGLTDDGRFDLAGSIASSNGQDPIRYHTHGVIGKEGVALVSVFESERFDALGPVIEGPLRTLAFAQGFAYADLPDTPPTDPEPDHAAGTANPAADVGPDAADTAPADPTAKAQTPQQDNISSASPAAKNGDPAPASMLEDSQPDGGALVAVLIALGVAMLAAVVVVVIVTHKQAQAKRERARARRERQGQHA